MMAMASKGGILLVIGVAIASVLASGAPPVQPPRIPADLVVMGFVPCDNGTSMRTGSAPGFAGNQPFSMYLLLDWRPIDVFVLVPSKAIELSLRHGVCAPGAVVQLRCTDAAADLAANATADGKGRFRMAVNTTVALSSVAGHCELVVGTPLASCNATLPTSGTLRSGLRLLVSIVFFPRGFSYVAPSA